MIGPLIVAMILAWRHDYHQAFACLAVLALATLTLVLGVRLVSPDAGHIAAPHEPTVSGSYCRAFWWYLVGAGLVALGFSDFSLLGYHLATARTVGAGWVRILYALAIGAGGPGSLAFGRLSDRFGLVALVPLTIVAEFYAPLAFLGGFSPALIGVLLWGIGFGTHESIMSASMADMVPPENLAAAYGLFTAVFGVAWFVGSAALGGLYDLSVENAAWLAMGAHLLAAIPILVAARSLRGSA